MNALLWGAVSSKKQAADDKISIQRQLELEHQHAEKWGLRIVGQLVIPGVSRSISLYDRAARSVQGYYIDANGHRSDVFVYAKLLELLEMTRDHPDRVDVFMFFDRSRLGRKASLSETVVELCNENGIKTYDLESPPNTLKITRSFEERMIGAFSSQRAQREVEKLSEAREAGLINRVKQGFFPTRLPFGYKPQYDERKQVTYVTDSDAINTVLMMQAFFLENGLGLEAIAKRLTELGRPTPRGAPAWSLPTVGIILDHALSYAGFVQWKQGQKDEIIVKGQHPAVITEERARAILAERDARASARRSVGAVYRFSRMLRCAVCGGKVACLSAWVTQKIASGEKAYYRERYVCPTHGGTSYNKLYDKMTEVISKLGQKEFMAEIEAQDNTAETKNALALLYQQVEDIEEKIRFAEELLFNKDLTVERYRARKAEFDAQVANLEREIEHLESILGQHAERGQRAERISEVQRIGLKMLNLDDIRSSNAWLRRYFRIYVAHGRIEKVVIL